MTTISLKNVRCFVDPQPAPIAPLTLLVGENSTGKSTFLAMTRVLADALGRFSRFDFNEEPFQLGAFPDIATCRPNGEQADSFAVSVASPLPADVLGSPKSASLGDVTFAAEFSRHQTEPALTKWEFNAARFGLSLSFERGGGLRELEIRFPGGSVTVPRSEIGGFPWSMGRNPFFLVEFLRACVNEPQEFLRAKIADRWTKEDVAPLVAIEEHLGTLFRTQPHAIAPVRSQPRRTYDPLTAQPMSGGQHAPMVLARLLREESVSSQRFSQAIQEFGRASGLFELLQVRKLRTDAGSPFQILVELENGCGFNLIDVGYGVSQALPIVVDILDSKEGDTLLIQQPEVHLHPRAQAALGSLLVNMAHSQDKRFLVETHSDYLVDRVRMEIRENEDLTPADVQILYFQREEDGGVEIYPLELDDHGNIVNAPAGYRDFFLREEERFLGV